MKPNKQTRKKIKDALKKVKDVAKHGCNTTKTNPRDKPMG